MKIVVCALTGILVNAVFPQILDDSIKVKHFIIERCQNFSSKAVTNDINSRFNDTKGYYKLFRESRKDFCSETRYTKLLPMLKQLKHDLRPCFPNKEEQYFPKFMSEGSITLVDFICANRTYEIFSSTQGDHCREALEYFKGEETTNCSRQFFGIFDEANVVTFEWLCLQIESASRCFDGLITMSCPSFVAYNSLNRNFFNAAGRLCSSGGTLQLNKLTIIAAVLFLIARCRVI